MTIEHALILGLAFLFLLIPLLLTRKPVIGIISLLLVLAADIGLGVLERSWYRHDTYILPSLAGLGVLAAVLILPNLAFVRRSLGLLLLTRYTLLIGLSLPLIGLGGGIYGLFDNSLLENLFTLEGGMQMFWVTLFSWLVAAMVLVIFRTTQLNAAARFGGKQSPEAETPLPEPLPRRQVWRWRWLWLLLMGCWIPASCFLASRPEMVNGDVTPLVIGLVAGTLAALFMLAALTALQEICLDERVVSPGLLPFEGLPWFRYLHEKCSLPGLYWVGDLLARVLSRLGPGYTEVDQDRVVRLRPGHAQLLLCLLAVLVFYATSYILVLTLDWFPVSGWWFSSLTDVLLILLLTGFVLGGAAFFFDYYRVPVLLILLLVASVLYMINRVDHFYKIQPGKPGNELALLDVFQHDNWKTQRWTQTRSIRPVTQEPILPDEFAKLHIKKDWKPTLFVVTSAGGGIQAAAWSARILAGLHERYGPRFTRSIGMISAVSGGSVGTIDYLDRWNPDWNPLQADSSPLTAADLAEIEEAAQSSSLEAAAWGLAYPDLIRLAFPPLANPEIDRGWAIERVWRKRLRHSDATLGDWTGHIRDGKLPVVIFNGTLVETGQRFVISPVLRQDQRPNSVQEQQFLQLYKNGDLDISTAARLSATFAYISPICRPSPQGRDPEELKHHYHVADGGYVDNEGMFTAVKWIKTLLDHANARGERPFDRIVFIRIQPFPIAPEAAPAASGSFLSELTGPLDTLANVRVASQAERNDLAIDLLRKAAQADAVAATRQHLRSLKTPGDQETRAKSLRALGLQDIEVDAVQFVYHPADGQPIPLSWKLTRAQRQMIRDAWSAIEAKDPAKYPEENPLTVLDQYFEHH